MGRAVTVNLAWILGVRDSAYSVIKLAVGKAVATSGDIASDRVGQCLRSLHEVQLQLLRCLHADGFRKRRKLLTHREIFIQYILFDEDSS